MLKKILPILVLAFILFSAPALASQNKNTSINSQSSCDEDDEWENHGSFVSCVAHLHQGGSVVSTAAKSDIGKIHDDDDDESESENEDEDEDSPSPSPSPSVSPVPSPTPTPSASPLATDEEIIQENVNLIEQLIESLKNIIDNLENLIS